MTLSRVEFWWFSRVSSWITRMLKSDLYVPDPVCSLLLLVIFPPIFALTWRIPWSICYPLEVCHYATKQPVPSRLRKDIYLHFNTSSPCTSPRLKSYDLLCPFCCRFWHLRPGSEPGFSFCSLPSLHIHYCHTEQWVWDKGPSSDIVASYSPVQCWGLQHKTLDWFFSNASWKSMCSK